VAEAHQAAKREARSAERGARSVKRRARSAKREAQSAKCRARSAAELRARSAAKREARSAERAEREAKRKAADRTARAGSSYVSSAQRPPHGGVCRGSPTARHQPHFCGRWEAQPGGAEWEWFPATSLLSGPSEWPLPPLGSRVSIDQSDFGGFSEPAIRRPSIFPMFAPS
jgi:hypothetical protein